MTATATTADVPQLTRTVRYTLADIRLTLRNVLFVFFTVGLPVIMFLLFDQIYGGQQLPGGATVGTFIMVNMASYGGLTAALNTGSLIQVERTNGWLRQLMVAGLEPRSFVTGKLIAAQVVVLPALIGVILAGVLLAGVEITAGEALRVLLVLWISMVPMVLLGLAVGLALKPSAVGPVVTIGTMLLAVAGGLWFPFEMFPDWLQQISVLLPTYWLGEIGAWGIVGGDLPLRGLAVLAAWTLGLVLACALLLGSAARRASRR
ncbi:ABC transporter permease [Brachybacterium sp. J144]|uniref:ABC transporter permease n=1 Tax=unclassified Brachybacterium TaxID=2623841 RepID=UPI002E79D2AD|nr:MULTISPECIES: ABC transporter permease [unclassified Brachybacterium]MEE1619343.1 ABC transporter permease [Brachybacterium sp. J153]MEE1651476.1 ABC transporter permease [Brachybacterium sp. J144]